VEPGAIDGRLDGTSASGNAVYHNVHSVLDICRLLAHKRTVMSRVQYEWVVVETEGPSISGLSLSEREEGQRDTEDAERAQTASTADTGVPTPIRVPDGLGESAVGGREWATKAISI